MRGTSGLPRQGAQGRTSQPQRSPSRSRRSRASSTPFVVRRGGLHCRLRRSSIERRRSRGTAWWHALSSATRRVGRRRRRLFEQPGIDTDGSVRISSRGPGASSRRARWWTAGSHRPVTARTSCARASARSARTGLGPKASSGSPRPPYGSPPSQVPGNAGRIRRLQESSVASGTIRGVREESHLDDMRSAIRGDFERLAERRGGQELMREPEPSRSLSRSPTWNRSRKCPSPCLR